MGSLTYPVPAISDAGNLSAEQIHQLLKSQPSIARRVRTLAGQRFISDAILKGRFETVERKGVPRSISVKAVNNIAILGTGQSAGFLDRGITRFFDRYTYSRLGVEMSLAQDVFLLRGLESRRGKELFLKGRLPFPIDVVNAQPGRTVSFQTMLRRLRSLDFGQAVTKPP